ncbi:ABC transporter ATP-binding protein [Occultella gossypii]|uniref:ABC transporter ATP-binding protein n=1 Tax=Occultella gossypii TaxID=2800820 RepID=A0ABS7SH78_9MICO|nr:ABC transporter ATP-binding protein [Occultella gossypii]MBZ2199683.1 ABC transporter ATP-binding protein [Occultella gossypii]
MTRTLTARGIAVRLGGTPILHGVDLDVEPGRVHALIGPNGAGKSTLLRALAQLITPDGGSVTSSGTPLAGLGARRRAQLVGFLPQDTGVDQDFTVRDVVAMGRYAHLQRWRGPGPLDADAVTRALARAGVADLAHRSVRTLSGGQRQLVLIAKQLAQAPGAYLLDEPVSALDVAYQLQVLNLLRDLAGDGSAVVAVLHDLNLAARCADTITMLHAGRVRASGSPAQVLTPDLMAEVYGVRAVIDTDPATGTPRVSALGPAA